MVKGLPEWKELGGVVSSGLWLSFGKQYFYSL